MTRQILRLTVLWIGVVLAIGCSSRHSKAPAAVEDAAEVRVYEVFGMDCPACHGGVEKLVLKIPGILEAKADWQEQRLVVVVGADIELNDELVYDAIRRANFTPGRRLK